MLVLSHSDTHYLNRNMAWCGCHDILIQRPITILCLANFSLYSTQLWLWWLSYSNHHFSLLVFSKVSTTPIQQEIISLAVRNYLFLFSVEGKLTFRDTSTVVIRTKRVNFLHRLCTKPTLLRNRKGSLFWNDRKSILITTADTELMFWIDFNILLFASSRSGYDALLSRINLHFRSHVWLRTVYELIPLQVSVLRLDELWARKCFNFGRNWLDGRLQVYLICVSHWHGWISLFNEFWLF